MKFRKYQKQPEEKDPDLKTQKTQEQPKEKNPENRKTVERGGGVKFN